MSHNQQNNDQIFISIIIPVYNEEKRITSCLDEITSYLKDKEFNHEIIVSDDGSSDETCNIVNKFIEADKSIKLLKDGNHRGKGAAVKKGMLKAQGEFALFMDCDLSVHIKELDKFLEEASKGAYIIIGSRRKKGAIIKVHQPFYREFLGYAFTILSNLILVMKVTDFTCGFKLFHRKVYRYLFEKQLLEDWSFDSEILYLACRNGYKVTELPITWQNNTNTKVKLSKDIVSSFRGIFKIRTNEISGKYNFKMDN